MFASHILSSTTLTRQYKLELLACQVVTLLTDECYTPQEIRIKYAIV